MNELAKVGETEQRTYSRIDGTKLIENLGQNEHINIYLNNPEASMSWLLSRQPLGETQRVEPGEVQSAEFNIYTKKGFKEQKAVEGVHESQLSEDSLVIMSAWPTESNGATYKVPFVILHPGMSIAIGRDIDNPMCVGMTDYVSREHCVVTNKEGRAEITDLSSTNGTFYELEGNIQA